MNPLKFPWTLAFVVLFVTVSLARSQLFYHGRRLSIAPKECSSSSKRFEALSGVCMFNLECQEKSGTVIGACVDQFLFGACCHIPGYVPPPEEKVDSIEKEVTITTTTSSTSSSSSLSPTIVVTGGSSPESSSTIKSTDFVDASTSALNNLYNVSFDASATFQSHMGSWNHSKFTMGASSPSTESLFPSTRPSTHSSSSSTSASVRRQQSSTSTEHYPTRFQPRPTVSSDDSVLSPFPNGRHPSSPHQDETVGALHRTDVPLSVGERPTSPSPTVAGSFLPLTLETFTSVSDPVTYGVHGSHANVHNANGQSHLAVEPTTLTLVTVVSNSSSDGGINSVNILKRTSSSSVMTSTSSSTSTSGDQVNLFSNGKNSVIISSNSLIKNYNNNHQQQQQQHNRYSRPTAIVNNQFSRVPTTQSPPKLSTFMYVDGDLVPQNDDDGGDSTTNSITENGSSHYPQDMGETTETDASVVQITEQLMLPAQQKIMGHFGGGSSTEFNEDLNTDNVWNVVMQLGPHGGVDPSKPPEVSSGEAEDDFSHLPIIASTMNSGGTTGTSQHLYSPIGPNALPLLATVLDAADAEEDFWRTTLTSVTKEVSQDLKEDGPSSSTSGDNEDDDEEADSTDSSNSKMSTPKPWASSTYMIHTFQYPNVNSTYSSEEESEETTAFSTNLDRIKKTNGSSPTIENGLMTWLSVDLHNEVTTTEKDSPTQLPSATDMKEDDSAQEMLELAEGIKNSPFLASEATYKPPPPPTTTSTTTTSTTTTTTTPTTTTTQATTTQRRRTTVTTTTTTNTPRPTTTTTTTQASTRLPSRATTGKWKRPSAYTLPPEKKRTHTTTTTTTTPEPETTTRRRTTTTTTTPAPIKRVAVITTSSPKPPKATRAPTTVPTKSTTPLLLAEEDIDTNLDYLVDQVVQNMAESLSGSDLDEVIRHPQIFDSSSSIATTHVEDTFPDSKFPPLPVLKDVHSPSKSKKPNKDKTPTQKRPTSGHRTLDYRKDCGVRTLKKSGRIVGGTASKFGQWPWQALVKEATWLGLFSKNKCGGVLIAPKYVLTAAHCQPGFLATLTVVLGDFDISNGKDKSSSQSVTKNVRRVIVHRDYNAQTFENDIALLELESSVEFAPHIVPICLPEDHEEFVGQQAFVTGWGRLKYGGGVPQILHEVDVPVLTNDNCQEMFQKSGHLKAIRESFICAGYAEGLKDSCEGDSGGPLSIKRETGQWVLAGTVSHGIKCAYPNLPGVYMRMTFYKPWIKKVTGLKT